MLFSKGTPEIRIRRKISPRGTFKSGIVFSVKNGLGKLRNEFGASDDHYDTNNILILGDTPLIQAEVPCCPTCRSLLMAGYGIENADSPELRAVCDAVNADFIDIEQSFEIMRPLLGLLEDGYYLLADAECIPTDGNGHFFWDIDPALHEYDAATSAYYISEEDGCFLCACEDVEPMFLYPTQSASVFNRERAEYYREHNRDYENAPRAIAFNSAYGISALLDGHHKAAAAAMNGQRVKCLLIIPSFEQFCKPADGEWEFSRQVFTNEIFFTAEDFTEKEIAQFRKEWVVKHAKINSPNRKKLEFSPHKFKPREWESEFAAYAEKYPTVRQLVLEKLFGITDRYTEIVTCLRDGLKADKSLYSLTDIDSGLFRNNREKGEEIPALRLLLEKARRDGDRSLKETAIEIVRKHFGGYVLTAAALRYLLMFDDDSDVEKVFVDIISDAEEYERYGDIAVDYWQDVL